MEKFFWKIEKILGPPAKISTKRNKGRKDAEREDFPNWVSVETSTFKPELVGIGGRVLFLGGKGMGECVAEYLGAEQNTTNRYREGLS